MSADTRPSFFFTKLGDLLGRLDYLEHRPDLFEIPQNTELLKARKNLERKVVLLTGPSGAGKDTVLNALPPEKYVRWKTVTTRAEVRPDELENDPYVRYSRSQFLEEVDKGLFIEFNEYADNLYGTHRAQAEEAFADGRIPVLRVDPSGAASFNKIYEEQTDPFHEANLIHFFITTPDLDELERRLHLRETKADKVEKRLAKAQEDMQYIGNSHFILVNNTNKLGDAIVAIDSVLRLF